MHDYQDVHQSWAVELCDWEDTVRVYISEALKKQIQQTQLLILQYDFICSIDIAVPMDFVHKDDALKLQRQCRYQYDKLSVFKETLYWNIQSKWDSSYQAEYDVTDLII